MAERACAQANKKRLGEKAVLSNGVDDRCRDELVQDRDVSATIGIMPDWLKT